MFVDPPEEEDDEPDDDEPDEDDLELLLSDPLKMLRSASPASGELLVVLRVDGVL